MIVRCFCLTARLVRKGFMWMKTCLIVSVQGPTLLDSVVFIKSDEKRASSVRVRLWRPGDAYQAMGRASSVKIKVVWRPKRYR